MITNKKEQEYLRLGVTAKETLELGYEKVRYMLGKKAKRKAGDATESSFAYNPSENIAFNHFY